MKDILVVDDSTTIQNFLAKNIGKNRNYRVITAEDGEVALDLVRNNTPDLIILDVILPRMNGIAFLKNLRKMERAKNIPVILMSGVMVDEEFKKEGFALGALDYLEKPVKISYLMQKIDSILSPEKS